MAVTGTQCWTTQSCLCVRRIARRRSSSHGSAQQGTQGSLYCACADELQRVLLIVIYALLQLCICAMRNTERLDWMPRGPRREKGGVLVTHAWRRSPKRLSPAFFFVPQHNARTTVIILTTITKSFLHTHTHTHAVRTPLAARPSTALRRCPAHIRCSTRSQLTPLCSCRSSNFPSSSSTCGQL